MIDPGYVRMMANYNTWQNNQLMPVLEAMPHDALIEDRGAFFNSILGTANHLLWGDMMWMSRFDPSMPAPVIPGIDSPELHPTITSWSADRFRVDGQIRFWAEALNALDLKGNLTWYSGLLEKEFTAPIAMNVVHFFNHQTHHRGQIHAMLTAAGQKAPVSDLALMPKDA